MAGSPPGFFPYFSISAFNLYDNSLRFGGFRWNQRANLCGTSPSPSLLAMCTALLPAQFVYLARDKAEGENQIHQKETSV